MKHPIEIEKYGSFTDLAEDLGSLRYDALRDFLNHLAIKLQQDGSADCARGRKQLGRKLIHASIALEEVAELVHHAWVICEPRMDLKDTNKES